MPPSLWPVWASLCQQPGLLTGEGIGSSLFTQVELGQSESPIGVFGLIVGQGGLGGWRYILLLPSPPRLGVFSCEGGTS